MKKVLIIYKFLPQYRVDFYQHLKNQLLSYNVDLQLIYGNSNKQDAMKGDEVMLDWAQFIPNKRYYLGKTELLWQPCLEHLRSKDMVIVQTENRLLLNYYLMLARRFSKFRLGFWGHVYNMQDDVNSRRNRIKLVLLHQCDWWFAYSCGVKKFLTTQGFPENKITDVQNAIDTVTLRKYYEEVSEDEVNRLRSELGIAGPNVGIFCGGMYPDKNLDFIFDTCLLVKQAIPDFHMIFIGSGTDAGKVAETAQKYDWMHYLGPKFGKERVPYFKLAALQLMPGLVGLAILDSFAMETPIVTAEHAFHSPEIDYLENGVNGIMTRYELQEYANTVTNILKTKQYRQLAQAGKKSAEKYTVQNMAANFTRGILECLGIPEQSAVTMGPRGSGPRGNQNSHIGSK